MNVPTRLAHFSTGLLRHVPTMSPMRAVDMRDLETEPSEEEGPAEESSPQGARSTTAPTTHLVLLAAIAVVWVWSLARTNEADLGDFGIVTIMPITAFLAIAATLTGLILALYRYPASRLPGTYVVGLAVMIHGMPTFVYDHLRFSWAWKHVGVVEYIQRTGSVDPSIDALPVYHAWPGFFGLNAIVTRTSGLDSALSYASWAPILFELLFLLALYVLFRGLTRDPRLIWTALTFFLLGNWVGQDYFAPQAMAYFLYLVVIAILLRWYGQRQDEALASASPEGDDPPLGSAGHLAVGGVLMVCLLAIAVSHQLTPIMTLVAIASLRLTRSIRVWWPLFAMAAFMAAWGLGPARSFLLENIEGVINEVGGLDSNLNNNLVAPELFNQAQLRISQVARLLSAAMVGLAGLGWLRRRKYRLPTKWVLVLAGAPAGMVLVSSYGGEVLFRAYLFALPFAAFLAASWWFPDEAVPHRRLGRVSLAAVMVTLVVGLLIADFGTDNRQVFNEDEVAAADFVFENAQPGALIIEGSRDYPRQHRNYEQFVYLALDRSRPDTMEGLLEDPAERLAGWLSDTTKYNSGYIIITQSQRRSVTALGTLLSPTLDVIEQSLLDSDLFEVVFEAGDARVFAPVEQP